MRWSALRLPLALAAVCVGGWLTASPAARALRGGSAVAPVTEREPFSAASYDSATRVLRGSLVPAARARLAAATGGRDAVLVLLAGRDHLVCEDLGRQLRELRARAAPALPLVVGTEASAAEAVRTFLRRERVRAAVVVLPPDSALAGQGRLPTPAALVARGGGALAEGVSHPLRFPNARPRSFADELDALLRSASAAPPADSSSNVVHGRE